MEAVEIFLTVISGIAGYVLEKIEKRLGISKIKKIYPQAISDLRLNLKAEDIPKYSYALTLEEFYFELKKSERGRAINEEQAKLLHSRISELVFEYAQKNNMDIITVISSLKEIKTIGRESQNKLNAILKLIGEQEIKLDKFESILEKGFREIGERLDSFVVVGEETKKRYEQILKILLERIPLPKDVEYSLRGRVAHYKGRYGSAITLFEKGINASARINKGKKHEQYKGTACLNIGITYFKLGELKNAFIYFQKARDIFIEIKLAFRVIDTEMLLARVFILKAKENPELLYEAQHRLATQLGNAENVGYKAGIADAKNRLGICMARLGNLKESYDLVKEAHRIYSEINDILGIISATANLQHLCILLDRKEEAEGYKKEMDKLMEQIPDLFTKADKLYGQALYFKHLGDYKTAKKLFNHCIKIYQKIKLLSELKDKKEGFEK